MTRFIHTLTLIALLATGPALAAPDFLVDADWLSEHKEDPGLVILEVRYHPHRYFTVGHIPGAVQVQRFRDLGDNLANPLMRFPTKEDFQATLRRFGVNDDSTLVLYDDASTALASRLYFLLALYGFPMEQVKVLNGGTIDWSAMEELSQEPVAPKPGGVTLKEANPDLFVEWTAVYNAVISRRDPTVVLLDARPTDMYTGEVIRHSIQAGHIPGAVNVVSLAGTDGQTQRWRDDEQLAALYAQIPKDKTLYVYCHDGFRMSLAWMQLRHLGYQDVRLYNGGWSHWGNSLTLPVVLGDQPYDDEFAL
jgi:thiosulfate/3-mercaptopyruvate sulfurtransferase